MKNNYIASYTQKVSVAIYNESDLHLVHVLPLVEDRRVICCEVNQNLKSVLGIDLVVLSCACSCVVWVFAASDGGEVCGGDVLPLMMVVTVVMMPGARGIEYILEGGG